MTHGTRLPQPAPAPRAPPAPGLVGSAPTQPPVVVQRQAGLEIYMAWGIFSHCTAWVTRKGLKIPDLLCSTAMLGWKTAAAAVAPPCERGFAPHPRPRPSRAALGLPLAGRPAGAAEMCPAWLSRPRRTLPLLRALPAGTGAELFISAES